MKEKTKSTNYANTGVSFMSLLTLAFIILKLVGVISWSWFFVLLPMIIEVSIVVIALLIIVMGIMIKRE